MKITILSTGGTIGSTITDKKITPNEEKSALHLRSFTDAYRDKSVEFEFVPILNILSENSNGNVLTQIITEVKKLVDISSTEAIIITHGTDTLQFTAAALGYAFANVNLPIVMVSANFPLEDKRSNGYANFGCAVDFIRQKISNGVFISYKNNDGNPTIHSALRLLSHYTFSDDIISAANSHFGTFISRGCFIKNTAYTAVKPNETVSFGDTIKLNQSSNIKLISPYVGFSYPEINDSVRGVIHNCYHSGTICTNTENMEKFFEDCRQKNIPVFLTGINSAETEYATASIYEKLPAIQLKNITPIAAYIKLWMLLDNSPDNIIEKMQTPISDEFYH